MTAIVDIQNVCEAGNIPSVEQINIWVNAALDNSTVELTIRIVDSDESQALNQQYRSKDKPTNVLSFPFDNEGVELEIPLLGDLVICAELVANEAEQQQKPLLAHWAHLIIHGCLHLLGYDHQQDAEAEIMENKEIEILQQLGYDNPYV